MAFDKIKMRDGFLWFYRGSSRQYMRDLVETDQKWEIAIRCWFSDETLAAWKAYEAGYLDGYENAREETE